MISLGSFNKQFQEQLVYYFERLQLFFGQFSTRQDVLCQIPAHLIRSERDLLRLPIFRTDISQMTVANGADCGQWTTVANIAMDC